MLAVETSGPADTEALGAELAAGLHAGDLVLVRGELGAGKTTLVRGAARALGVEDPVTSPTFGIGHRYRARDLMVAHLDLYRLQGLSHEDPALLEDYLGADRIAFVEWPEADAPALREAALRVTLAHAGGDRRRVQVEGPRAPRSLRDRAGRLPRGCGSRCGARAVTVLGFDTATPATAVALRLGDGTTLRARDDPGAGERPGHTTRLLGLARELLAQAGLRWGDLELVAVGVGPGTFTGLRVGVATGRGLAQSLGVDVAGVGTPRVLAQAAIVAAGQPDTDGGVGVRPEGVLAVIDARRGEAFVAAYTPSEPTAASAPHELTAVRALAPSELAGVAAAADPDLPWQAVGDGAVRFRAELEAAGIAVPADGSPLHDVDAGVLCELALVESHGAPEAVLPDYRRRPDAEIALENAQQ